MKRAVHVLAVGCALGVIAFSPVLALGLAPSAVNAAPALALVSGTVKDDGGRPLAGAIVALLEIAFNGRELKSVKTDAEGKFSAEILPGNYRLRAAAEGFRPVLARVALEGATKFNYDFALKRVDTPQAIEILQAQLETHPDLQVRKAVKLALGGHSDEHE